MSLAIDPESVGAVLIGGNWASVDVGTFDLDAYEFAVDGATVATNSVGFIFTTDQQPVCGPLSAIQAIQLTRQP